MTGRTALMRERAMAMAVAFGDPDQIEKMYPEPLKVGTAVKWWGDDANG